MSVIIQRDEDYNENRYLLFIKGADNIIKERLFGYD